MHVITISATYGAAGSVVGPAVAERLGVPFHDRAIPTAVASDLGITLEHALSRDEHAPGWLSRLLDCSRADVRGVDDRHPDRRGRRSWPTGRLLACTQTAIRTLRHRERRGHPGSGGAIVLRDHPTALHVRLDGDPKRRVRQAMAILGARPSRRRRTPSPATTTRERPTSGTSTAPIPPSPELYDLVLDSTRIPPEACVDLIVAAATSPHRRAAHV